MKVSTAAAHHSIIMPNWKERVLPENNTVCVHELIMHAALFSSDAAMIPVVLPEQGRNGRFKFGLIGSATSAENYTKPGTAKFKAIQMPKSLLCVQKSAKRMGEGMKQTIMNGKSRRTEAAECCF